MIVNLWDYNQKSEKITKETAIKLFQDQKVRVQWEKDQEKWYFSIIDVMGV